MIIHDIGKSFSLENGALQCIETDGALSLD